MYMEKHTENCMICGMLLEYFESVKDVNCHICGKSHQTNATCVDGHYVCDDCHSEEGLLFITSFINRTTSRDPIAISKQIMKNPVINMHGPEHHYLTAASLLAAYRNSGGEVDFSQAMQNTVQRAKNVPGGICGYWGSCGAGIATGIFISVITGATPLSGKEWSLANEMTSKSLATISENGGPRCCKRNSQLAILQAAAFVKERFNIIMELPERIDCEFSSRNSQCRENDCLFYSGN